MPLRIHRGSWLTALVGAASLAICAAPAPADAGRGGPYQGALRVAGRYLIDQRGRVVILHGLFAVWKQPPYYPAGTDDPANPATPSFTSADADEVRALGLDGVRLSWYWQGLEPLQHTYDQGYLAGLAGAERKFASRGVYVVLDAHQDQYDKLFGNEPGFPAWSAITEGQAPAPAPADPGYAGWKFPLGYFHPSTELAFGNLYANTAVAGQGVGTAFANAWQTVVRRFVNDPMVAGYDLINEPFPGTASTSAPYVSSCAAAVGCPAFDQQTVEPFQVSIARAIRRVDQVRPVFFEPTFFFNGGVPAHFVAPPAAVRPVGLSFHNQCPSRSAYSIKHDPAIIALGRLTCPPVAAGVFRNGANTAATLGGPGLMTEVASTSDDDVQGLNCLLEQADHFQTGYTYGLSWSNPNDELRRLSAESAANGAAPFKERILARVYPRAVAGIPLSYGFDVRTGRFELSYRVLRRVRAPTVISIPVTFQYPEGYRVAVHGARVRSRPGSPSLELVNNRRARIVSVTVTPAQGGAIARPLFPACSVDPSPAKR